MSWEHCGQDVPDTVPCPACGKTKAEWTVEFQATSVSPKLSGHQGTSESQRVANRTFSRKDR